MEPIRPAAAKEDRVRCVRLDEDRTPEEHLDCPYCHGRVADVRSGQRAQFCDFEPGKDPVAFGFPEGTTRTRD